MVYYLSSQSDEFKSSVTPATVAQAERILVARSPEQARVLLAATGWSERYEPEDIAARPLDCLEAALEDARLGLGEAPASSERVEHPTNPAILCHSTVAKTREQLAREAGAGGGTTLPTDNLLEQMRAALRAGDQDRIDTLAYDIARRPVVLLRFPLFRRREPISRGVVARRAKPATSRAPPSGDSDSDDPDPDPDPAGVVAWLRRRR